MSDVFCEKMEWGIKKDRKIEFKIESEKNRKLHWFKKFIDNILPCSFICPMNVHADNSDTLRSLLL